jgi:hypothetical protein
VPYAITIKNINAVLAKLGEYGQSKGIEVWLEVHGRGTQEPKTAAEILVATARNVGACWNSNTTDVKNGSVKQRFDLLKPFLRCAHMNELYSSYPGGVFPLAVRCGIQALHLGGSGGEQRIGALLAIL